MTAKPHLINSLNFLPFNLHNIDTASGPSTRDLHISVPGLLGDSPVRLDYYIPYIGNNGEPSSFPVHDVMFNVVIYLYRPYP